MGGGISKADKEISVSMLGTSSNFNDPRSLRDWFVLEVVLVDCSGPEFPTDRTYVGCVGPVGGAPLPRRICITAAIRLAGTDELVPLEIAHSSISAKLVGG